MEFAKQFYRQTNLDGIIVDERWNSGGWMPYFFVDRLAAEAVSYWALRHVSAQPPAVRPTGYQVHPHQPVGGLGR